MVAMPVELRVVRHGGVGEADGDNAGGGWAAYDVPAVATMTDQLQKDARRPENKDDQLKQLMAQGAVKYLDAREWADKTYRHYAVSQSMRVDTSRSHRLVPGCGESSGPSAGKAATGADIGLRSGGGCGGGLEWQDPSSDQLLPDLPPGLGHVRTLVLDLNDVRAQPLRRVPASPCSPGCDLVVREGNGARR